MPYTPPPELSEMSLTDIAEQVRLRKLPPVSEWSPENEGESHMVIKADGTWLHDGSPVKRRGMVRAFSSLLTRDDAGTYWLVTPYQKLSIEVEDAAFTAVDAAQREDGIAFRLNTDDLVVAGPDHPITARGNADTPALYLGVRNGCEARLNRSTYEQLAELALAQGDDWTVSSQNAQFSLVPDG